MEVLGTGESKMYLPVTKFYAGKSIFLTGGTGFLGKVILEKLLYSCEEIENIYVLVRPKIGVSAEQRIKNIIELPLFSRLYREKLKDLRKIVPIVGDLGIPNLGLSKTDEQMLLDKVSVTFHAAASVKFDYPLREVLDQNVGGTRNVVDLCRRMKHIQALVYISTAFCQSDKQVIEEIVYPPPAALDDVYSYLEIYGDDKNKIKELLNGRPNTYTFSKALAEALVAEKRGHVPTVIIRPSIVTATYREPFPSWVDSWSASSLMLMFVAKGLIRVQMGHKNFVTDAIPVDYVTNLSIVAASRCSSSNEVTVYNGCTSDVNPMLCQECFDFFTEEGLENNFNDLPMPGFIFVTSIWMKTLLIFLLETIPAYTMDFFSLIQGKNKRFVKLHRKISVIRDLCEPFVARSWLMTSQNTRVLAASLSSYDREMFPFNPANIVWKDCIPLYFEGVKRYLIKKEKD